MNKNLRYKIGDHIIGIRKDASSYNKIGKIIDIDDKATSKSQPYFVEFYQEVKDSWEGKTSYFGNGVKAKEGYCKWMFREDIKFYSPLKKFLKTKGVKK